MLVENKKCPQLLCPTRFRGTETCVADRQCMSATFVAAITGEKAGTLQFPRGRHTSSLHSLLGQGAYLFSFLVDGKRVTVDQTLEGNIEVIFLKQHLTFNIYFHEEVTLRMWLGDSFAFDVISQLGISKPLDVLKNVDKYGRVKVALQVGAFWKACLKPQLERRVLECSGKNDMLVNLTRLIDHDIMKVRQIAWRNILQEITNPRYVDIFLSLDAQNYLNLRLQSPTDKVIGLAASDELAQIILRTPLH